MALRPDDPRSPARQIVDELRRMIAVGELAPGEQLPSNTEMRNLYGVSNQTAQNAIGALKNEDLVYSVPGRGVFVRSDLDQSDLLRRIGGDGDQSEMYNNLLGRLDELSEAQSNISGALKDLRRRVEAIEEREGVGQAGMNQPSSMSDG